MENKKIKEVRYNAIARSLMVEFEDGSKYGEIGETAAKTFKELQERDFDDADLILKQNEGI